MSWLQRFRADRFAWPARRPRGPVVARAARGVSLTGGLLCFGLIAVIILSFLGTGIDLRDHAVRATAMVASVRLVGYGSGRHAEFSLTFTDRQGRRLTEQTEEVQQGPFSPAPGDQIQIYYASDNPANVSDAGYGRPGTEGFQVASVFGGLLALALAVAAVLRIRRWRRIRAARFLPLIG